MEPKCLCIYYFSAKDKTSCVQSHIITGEKAFLLPSTEVCPLTGNSVPYKDVNIDFAVLGLGDYLLSWTVGRARTN